MSDVAFNGAISGHNKVGGLDEVYGRCDTSKYNGDPKSLKSLYYTEPTKSKIDFKSSKQHLKPAGNLASDIIRLQNKDIEYGRRITPGMKRTMMDSLRDFHYDHRKLSIAAGCVGIVAMSTLLGVATGWAIDELAHITDRKNDKVGLVIGLFVGLATAFTQSMQMFGMARRGALRYRALPFTHDANSPEGQSFELISRRSPVMLAAMIRNAKSLKGYQHDNLPFLDTHVRDAMNICIREGYGRNIWKNSLEEYTPEQFRKLGNTDNLAKWQATENCIPLDFKKGNFYVARHTDVTHFLEEEINHSFDDSERIRRGLFQRIDKKTMIDALIHFNPTFGDRNISREWEEYNGNRLDNVCKAISAEFDEYDNIHGNMPHYQMLQHRVKNNDSNARQVNRYLLQLVHFMNRDRGVEVTKSFVRVDEVTKVKLALNGLRAKSLHTWVANLRDSFSAAFTSSTDGANQGAVAGNQLFMFIPLTICASVVSVLLLGMSSNSGGATNGAGTKGAGQDATFGVFPAYEGGHKKKQADSQQQPDYPVYVG